MINSLVPAIEAFLTILFNLPFSVFAFFQLVLAFFILMGVIKLFVGGR